MRTVKASAGVSAVCSRTVNVAAWLGGGGITAALLVNGGTEGLDQYFMYFNADRSCQTL